MADPTIHFHPSRKGGVRPALDRPRLDATPFLRLVSTQHNLPPHPVVDDAPALSYPMDENDAWGDCVVAAWDHFAQVVSGLLGGAYTNLSTAELLELYRTQNPNFDPASPDHGAGSADDGGMVIQLLLEELRRRGKIVAFAAVDYTNAEVMDTSTYVFLGVIIAAQLQAAQVNEQFDQGLWDYVPGQPYIGGHCIPVVGYSQCVSWAKVVRYTPRFLGTQVTEAWVVITQEQLDRPGFRDTFDVAGFAQAFHDLTGDVLPVAPAPEPTPTPAPPAPQPSPTPTPTPAPEPTPTPPPGGGASFQVTDAGVVARVEEVAAKRSIDPDEWLTNHLRHYFRIFSVVELDLGVE